MSDRQRHRAFAFSALAVVVVVAFVWLVERPHAGHAARGERNVKPRQPVVIGGESSSPPAGEAGTPAPSRAPRPERQPREVIPGGGEIVVTARRFSDAYVKYEVGQLPTEVRRTIRSTATLPFANSLLSAPPRVPDGVRTPPPARVWSVDLPEKPTAGQAGVAVELRSAEGEISTLTEVLSRGGGKWRVSGLG